MFLSPFRSLDANAHTEWYRRSTINYRKKKLSRGAGVMGDLLCTFLRNRRRNLFEQTSSSVSSPTHNVFHSVYKPCFTCDLIYLVEQSPTLSF